MAVHAEAVPLSEPLPGGSEGANVVVEPLACGEAEQPLEALERPPGLFWRLAATGVTVRRRDWVRVPIQAFLVRHPRAGPILIDTGLHPSVALDPRQNLGRLLSRYFRPHLPSGHDVPSRLRARGLDPGQIGIVILTHLHYDHASAISEFPESTFVLTREEWVAATTDPRPILRFYRPSHFDHLFDYRTVDMESEDVGSYGPFARTFDLLGDGSIRLAYTPGHSAGHMSVILRLPRRDFIVAGDAVYTWHQLEAGPPPAFPVDEHNWRRSHQELQLFHREYPYAIIVPGHDPEVWAQLDDRYEE